MCVCVCVCESVGAGVSVCGGGGGGGWGCVWVWVCLCVRVHVCVSLFSLQNVYAVCDLTLGVLTTKVSRPLTQALLGQITLCSQILYYTISCIVSSVLYYIA